MKLIHGVPECLIDPIDFLSRLSQFFLIGKYLFDNYIIVFLECLIVRQHLLLSFFEFTLECTESLLLPIIGVASHVLLSAHLEHLLVLCLYLYLHVVHLGALAL
jgi:hypothetical protein